MIRIEGIDKVIAGIKAEANEKLKAVDFVMMEGARAVEMKAKQRVPVKAEGIFREKADAAKKVEAEKAEAAPVSKKADAGPNATKKGGRK